MEQLTRAPRKKYKYPVNQIKRSSTAGIKIIEMITTPQRLIANASVSKCGEMKGAAVQITHVDFFSHASKSGFSHALKSTNRSVFAANLLGMAIAAIQVPERDRSFALIATTVI